MKSTINTAAGKAVIEAHPGVVVFNGAVVLPHEAMLMAGELERVARKADELAMSVVPEREAA